VIRLVASGLASALFLMMQTLAAAPQRVVSINLCADQLLLALAAEEQIQSLSWLASDPHESPVWTTARRFPGNQGSVEELLALDPDLVLAGRFTGGFTKTFLKRLGYSVLEIPPADSIAAIYANIRSVAHALQRSRRGEQLITAMAAAVESFQAGAPALARPALLVQPGGFTVGADSVAHELLLLAGFTNQAAIMGLDRWGSLSLEALLSSGAQRIVVATYRTDAPSLANQFMQHRVFRRLRRELDIVPVAAQLLACGTPASLEAVRQMNAAAP
jgi:iron complex transport system substrate-binding protein